MLLYKFFNLCRFTPAKPHKHKSTCTEIKKNYIFQKKTEKPKKRKRKQFLQGGLQAGQKETE